MLILLKHCSVGVKGNAIEPLKCRWSEFSETLKPADDDWVVRKTLQAATEDDDFIISVG